MSMSMNNLYSFLVTFSNALFKVQKIVLLVAVFIVVTVNFANVCLRYMASYSLNYCEMLSVVLFMFMVLIGANMLLVCDMMCSLFTYPLPISTMSALFGAPIIIWIILKK